MKKAFAGILNPRTLMICRIGFISIEELHTSGFHGERTLGVSLCCENPDETKKQNLAEWIRE